jgi:hypothetical protein
MNQHLTNNTNNAQNSSIDAVEFIHKDDKSSETKEAMIKFKEEIISDSKAIENNLKLNYIKLKDEYEEKTNDYEKRLEILTIKLNELSSFTSVDRVKIDKISDMVSFQQLATDRLNQHEYRLNNLEKDLKAACYKYDRIFLDNLEVPGYIGEYCKFKNLKQYIEDNISTVQNILTFKDKHTLELKEYKDKLDGMLQGMSRQLEMADKSNKNYTNKIMQEQENTLKSQFTDLDNKLYTIKIDNNKYAIQLQKSSHELSIEYDKILKIKDDINSRLEESVKNMKDSNKLTVNHFDTVKADFEKIKGKFTEVADFIKVTNLFNNYIRM